jgi:hypothetical protein
VLNGIYYYNCYCCDSGKRINASEGPPEITPLPVNCSGDQSQCFTVGRYGGPPCCCAREFGSPDNPNNLYFHATPHCKNHGITNYVDWQHPNLKDGSKEIEPDHSAKVASGKCFYLYVVGKKDDDIYYTLRLGQEVECGHNLATHDDAATEQQRAGQYYWIKSKENGSDQWYHVLRKGS